MKYTKKHNILIINKHSQQQLYSLNFNLNKIIFLQKLENQDLNSHYFVLDGVNTSSRSRFRIYSLRRNILLATRKFQ